jgi:hypothetical protein
MWTPPAAFQIHPGDRLTVVARRAGLNWLLARAAAPDDDEPAVPEQRAPSG